MRKDGCGPASPQDIVYPILSEKSLLFCEKTSCNELFTKFPNEKKTKQRGVQKILVFQNAADCHFHYSR